MSQYECMTMINTVTPYKLFLYKTNKSSLFEFEIIKIEWYYLLVNYNYWKEGKKKKSKNANIKKLKYYIRVTFKIIIIYYFTYFGYGFKIKDYENYF